MKMGRTYRRIARLRPIGLAALVWLAVAGAPGPRADSPDQTSMGRLLERNQSDLRFFDNCVSNLPLNDAQGQPDALRIEASGLFREALQHDYNANLFFLQGDYSRTHGELKQAQNFLQQAYEKVLRRYNDTTLALLDAASPVVVQTRDQAARGLIRKGFQNLARARNMHTRGYNINPRYHTNQLHYYRRGIAHARLARKYALLAMVEARLPLEERDQYQLVTYDDVRSGSRKNDPAMNDYDRMAVTLRNMILRNMIPAEVGTRNLPIPVKLPLLEVHQDNFDRLIEDRGSIWLEETNRLNLSRYYTDYSLPKRNSENRAEISPEDSDPVELETAEPEPGAGETTPGPATDNQPTSGLVPAIEAGERITGREGALPAGESEDSYF